MIFVATSGKMCAVSIDQRSMGHLSQWSMEHLVKFSLTLPGLYGKVIDISGGPGHTVFVTEAGIVYVCGWMEFTDVNIFGMYNWALAQIPVSLPDGTHRRVKCSSGGYLHTILLTEDGDIFAYGHGGYGELGLGETKTAFCPTLITIQDQDGNAEKIKSVSCGRFHSVFLTTRGQVYVCGDGQCGQLGTGNTENVSIPVSIYVNSPIFEKDDFSSEYVKSVSCGAYHTVFLTISERVYVCGDGSYGQLGLPASKREVNDIVLRPTLLEICASNKSALSEKIKGIFCGDCHTIFLTVSGKVYGCGEAWSGKLGIDPEVMGVMKWDDESHPICIDIRQKKFHVDDKDSPKDTQRKRIMDISCGSYQSVFLCR